MTVLYHASRRLRGAAAAILLSVAAGPALAQAGDPVAELPAGTYGLDRAHASLIFRVDHLGFSHFTARFTRFDATLDFDPADPTAMQVSATVDAASIETDYPDPASYDFNADLRGAPWLDAAQHPQMTFVSTAVVPTGALSADVTGDLTLRGVTRPVTLAVTFNGGYAGHPLDPSGSRIGFSARGTLMRADFGMGFGIPEPGTTMGVGNAVEVIVEAEFTRPKDGG
ncbi:MAG: YceI family protein [Alphaproteobacteria bacterium]